MAEYAPITTAAELDLTDSDDVIAGYYAGRDGAREPGSDKSKSYWHGWRNGMMDTSRMPQDDASRALAGSFVRTRRAH